MELPGPDWFPVDYDATARAVTWFHLPGERFSEAFFEDTLRKHGRLTKRISTSVSSLATAIPGGRDPSAIFFHSSRCGSTLVMQLLGLVPGARALSEPPVLDAFLQDASIEDSQLRGLIHALGRSPATDARTFLKTDSWHLPHLARIRRTFPRTPCFFLYRNPADILRSHRRERGLQMVPGMIDTRILGIDTATINPADLDGHAERVLTAIFRQAVHAAEAGHLVPVAHSQLPDLLWDRLGPHLQLPDDGWGPAKQRSLYNAKHSHLPYPPAGPAPADHLLPPDLANAFERLEAIREAAQSQYFHSPA